MVKKYISIVLYMRFYFEIDLRFGCRSGCYRVVVCGVVEEEVFESGLKV